MEPVAPGTESGTTLDPPRDSSESPIGSAKVTNATVQTRTDGPIVYGSESTPSPAGRLAAERDAPVERDASVRASRRPRFPSRRRMGRRRRGRGRRTAAFEKTSRTRTIDGEPAFEVARGETREESIRTRARRRRRGWTTSALFAPTKDGENDRDGDRDRDGDVDGVPKGVPVCSALVAAREPRERGWDPRLRFESESFGATSASERRKSFSAGDLADLDRASVPA